MLGALQRQVNNLSDAAGGPPAVWEESSLLNAGSMSWKPSFIFVVPQRAGGPPVVPAER